MPPAASAAPLEQHQLLVRRHAGGMIASYIAGRMKCSEPAIVNTTPSARAEGRLVSVGMSATEAMAAPC